MISGYVLKNLLRWKINGEFPDIKKSIIIFAPHTTYYDALFGKLFLNEVGIRHAFLSKKELFFFPMNLIMKWYGSIPIHGAKSSNNTIYEVSQMFNNATELHIVMSPEGTRKKVAKWNKGFYYMALKANIPIIVGYMDYKKKEVGIKGVIHNLESIDSVMQQINLMYKDVTAKYPEKFQLNQKY